MRKQVLCTGYATMHTNVRHRSSRLWSLVSTLLVFGQPVVAGEGNMRKVGIVAITSVETASRAPWFKRLTETISASVPDQNITFELRSAEGNNDRYPQIIADLIQHGVDVIIAGAAPAAVAARKATSTVPIVFLSAPNPVALGLVQSLEKPNGNATGVYEELREFPNNRMALVKELVPHAKTIGILWDLHTWGELAGGEMARQSEKAVLVAGARAEIVSVKEPDDLERAFSVLKHAPVDALFVEQSPVFILQARKLVKLAAEANIPVIYSLSNYPQAGGLASLGGDLDYNLQRVADYVAKVLKGANPADLPVERSQKTLLVINARAASDLGIAIPPQVRMRADSIIE
jgi:putative ABC transport system substrate-binding protein